MTFKLFNILQLFLFLIVYICVSVCGSVHMYAGAQDAYVVQKARGFGSPGTGVTGVMSHLTWLLGPEIDATTRADCSPNCSAASLGCV